MKEDDRKRALVSRLLQYSLVHHLLRIPFHQINIRRTTEAKPYLVCTVCQILLNSIIYANNRHHPCRFLSGLVSCILWVTYYWIDSSCSRIIVQTSRISTSAPRTRGTTLALYQNHFALLALTLCLFLSPREKLLPSSSATSLRTSLTMSVEQCSCRHCQPSVRGCLVPTHKL